MAFLKSQDGTQTYVIKNTPFAFLGTLGISYYLSCDFVLDNILDKKQVEFMGMVFQSSVPYYLPVFFVILEFKLTIHETYFNQ